MTSSVINSMRSKLSQQLFKNLNSKNYGESVIRRISSSVLLRADNKIPPNLSDQQTTVTVISDAKIAGNGGVTAPTFINKYSTKGFVIHGSQLLGSIAVLPRTYFSWRISSIKDITPESLALFPLVEPKLDLLVIGTGEKTQLISQDVRDFLKSHQISLEVQDTRSACATYNFLLEEGRMAGAALIPPGSLPIM